MVGEMLKAVLILTFAILSVSSQKTIVSLGTTDPEHRKLLCTLEEVNEGQTDLSGAIFYLNGEDVRMSLIPGRYTDEGNGKITFTMRPELEGQYTCYVGVSCPGVCQALAVVATPSANESIPRYYLQRAGDSITMICGTRQGPLITRYTASWLINQTINAEIDINSKERVDVVRDELKDFSLTISQLTPSDSNDYHCFIEIVTNVDNAGDLHRITNPTITLQVYEEPVIHFLTSDRIYIAGQSSGSLNFSCNATGSPNLQIVWKHNDIQISLDSENFLVVPGARGFSTLHIKEPKLAASGNITCEAIIQYARVTDDGQKGELTEISRRLFRRLVILDSSLELRPYVTQDEDLLLRMDIPEKATLPESTIIRLKIIPEDNLLASVDMSVDDVFFEGSRFYAFVPASELKGHRRFHVQVALVVDDNIGPFGPQQTSQNQYVDIDEGTTCKENIIIFIGAAIVGGLVLVLFMLLTIVAILFYLYHKNKLKYKKDIKMQEDEHNFKIEQSRILSQMFSNIVELLKEEMKRNKPNGNFKNQMTIVYLSLEVTQNILMRRFNRERNIPQGDRQINGDPTTPKCSDETTSTDSQPENSTLAAVEQIDRGVEDGRQNIVEQCDEAVAADETSEDFQEEDDVETTETIKTDLQQLIKKFSRAKRKCMSK